MSKVQLDTSAYSAFMGGDVAVKERLQTADAIYFLKISQILVSHTLPAK